MAISDRIVVLNGGRIEDQGPPARVYSQPASLFAADFMGEMNHLPGNSDGRRVETRLGTLTLDAGRTLPTDAVTVCIRPEALERHTGAIDLGTASVENVTFFGSYGRVHLAVGDTPSITLVAHWPIATLPASGDRLRVSVAPDNVQVFSQVHTA